MTDTHITKTPVVGAGVGVDVGDFFEVIAEGALAPGRAYPPAHTRTTGPAGLPSSFVLIEEERVDRYALGGVRLLPPTRVVRPFGEFAFHAVHADVGLGFRTR